MTPEISPDVVRQKLAARTHVTPEGCHEWTGSLYDKGYGRICYGGRAHRAHRTSWVLANGPIPPGMNVCHKCDNPKCHNIAHLFLGTQADNIADMMTKGRVATGDRNCKTKLTPDDVRFIFTSSLPREDLANKFGVNVSTIYEIRGGRRWSHVTGLKSPWKRNRNPRQEAK